VGERTNLSVAVRYLHTNFLDRPQVDVDINQRLHDRDLILGAICINRINFFKTRNIRQFNITEDAPVGFVASTLVGKDYPEFETRNYYGGQIAAAMYNKSGYYLLNLQAGTFVPLSNAGRRNNVLELNGNYFTPLIRWHAPTYETFFVPTSS